MLLFVVLELLMLFSLSFVMLFFFRKVAIKINLVDRPNARKQHQGVVPLIGGVSIGISFLCFLFFHSNVLPHTEIFSISIIVLLLVGVLDDRYDISFKIRFLVQGLLSIAMLHFSNITLHTFGDLLGFGTIHLGWFGYVIAVFGVTAVINAFNMVDGIDGLLGGLSIVTFGAMGVLLYHEGYQKYAYVCLATIVTIFPYILLNLGILGRRYKVFMGDAGSMMIGFIVAWFLVSYSQFQQPEAPLLRPVTALWFIAVPLMDMAAIMIRRMRRGDSPFKPDREHLHHIFQRLGLSSLQTLILICTLASIFAGIGYYGEVAAIPESVMFYSFIVLFGIYSIMLSYVWKITTTIRRWFHLETIHSDNQNVTDTNNVVNAGAEK